MIVGERIKGDNHVLEASHEVKAIKEEHSSGHTCKEERERERFYRRQFPCIVCPRTNKECNEVNCRRIAIIHDPRQELARTWRPYGCNCIKNLYGNTERAVKSAGAQATVDRVGKRSEGDWS